VPSPSAPTTGIDSGISARKRAGQKRHRQWASAGLRLWAAVALALYVVIWLELDNALGVGTSAAIVCQPSLGASLRNALFRKIGIVFGAAAIVVLTACFPQNHIGFQSSCRAYSMAVIQRIGYSGRRPLCADSVL
jgi:hypothetical protein